MAKNLTYRVAGPFAVLGHAPGSTFKGPLPKDVNEEALLQSGGLQLAEFGSGEDAPEKHPCPACVAQEMKRPPQFESQDELVDHYADKHPGLVPPELGEE